MPQDMTIWIPEYELRDKRHGFALANNYSYGPKGANNLQQRMLIHMAQVLPPTTMLTTLPLWQEHRSSKNRHRDVKRLEGAHYDLTLNVDDTAVLNEVYKMGASWWGKVGNSSLSQQYSAPLPHISTASM